MTYLSLFLFFQFIEKFQEVKEATRQAAQQKAQQQQQQTNGTASTPVTSASASPCSSRSVPTPPVPPSQTPEADDCPPIDHVVSSLPSNVNDLANTLKSSLVAHQRSQSLSGLQASKVSGTGFFFYFPIFQSLDYVYETTAIPHGNQYENWRGRQVIFVKR